MKGSLIPYYDFVNNGAVFVLVYLVCLSKVNTLQHLPPEDETIWTLRETDRGYQWLAGPEFPVTPTEFEPEQTGRAKYQAGLNKLQPQRSSRATYQLCRAGLAVRAPHLAPYSTLLLVVFKQSIQSPLEHASVHRGLVIHWMEHSLIIKLCCREVSFTEKLSSLLPCSPCKHVNVLSFLSWKKNGLLRAWIGKRSVYQITRGNTWNLFL